MTNEAKSHFADVVIKIKLHLTLQKAINYHTYVYFIYYIYNKEAVKFAGCWTLQDVEHCEKYIILVILPSLVEEVPSGRH